MIGNYIFFIGVGLGVLLGGGIALFAIPAPTACVLNAG